MNRSELVHQILEKRSFLCVGLDTDMSRIPAHLRSEEDPIFTFNKAIIDATQDLCVAYKPNIAFYEAMGAAGWESLRKTLDYIPDTHFTIADAKRGDIGNTSRMYAKTFFETYDFDSITVAPYMGQDSVEPFLEWPEKWVILLALTSNPGGNDFQHHKDEVTGMRLFETVMQRAQDWGTSDNLMFVTGATRAEYFKDIRAVSPDHFLLVPGIGAQGGDFEGVCQHGMNDDVGLLINSSRGILYAGGGEHFAMAARDAAGVLQGKMELALSGRF